MRTLQSTLLPCYITSLPVSPGTRTIDDVRASGYEFESHATSAIRDREASSRVGSA